MNPLSPVMKRMLQWVLLAVLVAGGIGVRRHVLNAQRSLTEDGTLEYSLESALAFRRMQMVYRDGELPSVDRGIEYPDGVVPEETDTLGAENLMVAAAKAWPGTLRLDEKIRWLHLLWFCLGIPALFFWIKWMGGGLAGGFWGTAFYAVAVSAVARSTGQELSHENYALPFLVWHLAVGAWARNRAGSLRSRMIWGWVSAGLAGLALCTWDLVQYYLMMVMALGLWRALRGRMDKVRLWTEAVPLMAVLLAAAVRNPYLVQHHFWASPVMALGWGMLVAGSPVAQRQRGATRVILALIPIGLLLAFSHLFLPSYSHFASLFWAKLRCFNIRPEDPALLTFEQRILWVPALNSTSWHLLWKWFPCLLLLTVVLIWVFIRRIAIRQSTGKEFFPLLFFFVVSFVSFILFFRFHVWLVLFACALLGLVSGQVLALSQGWRRRAWMGLLAAGLLMEGGHTLRDPHRWGRPNVYATEARALMEHLRTYAAPEPVLANFGISAAIATYGGCPVVLHPKFESPAIRDRVKEYGEVLFLGDEDGFAEWMQAHGATVYVHSMGEFASIKPGLQMRYMVDAMDPPTNSAARLFEQRPEELKRFVPQFANRKYRVYRLKSSPVAARYAETLAGEGQVALEAGELDVAELRAAHALRMDAGNESAQAVLRHASALRDAGFRSEDESRILVDPPFWAPANAWCK